MRHLIHLERDAILFRSSTERKHQRVNTRPGLLSYTSHVVLVEFHLSLLWLASKPFLKNKSLIRC